MLYLELTSILQVYIPSFFQIPKDWWASIQHISCHWGCTSAASWPGLEYWRTHRHRYDRTICREDMTWGVGIKWLSCSIFFSIMLSLVPRPRPLTGKRVWWQLSDFLVVPSQQYWFWTNTDYLLGWCRAYFIGLRAHLDDVTLFHWLVQNEDCWLSTIMKLLNCHQTLFLMRGRIWARDYIMICSNPLSSNDNYRCHLDPMYL